MPLMFVIQGGAMCFRQLKIALNPSTEQIITIQLLELKNIILLNEKTTKQCANS